MSTAIYDNGHEYTPIARVITFTLTTGNVPLYAVIATTGIAAVVVGVVHTTADTIDKTKNVMDGDGESGNHPRHGVVHRYTVIA